MTMTENKGNSKKSLQSLISKETEVKPITQVIVLEWRKGSLLTSTGKVSQIGLKKKKIQTFGGK